ncbi:MAG: DUF4278 domain-containing protein [Prochlorotrichaceae cyanobacterium]|jgi:hypothetical protein
MQLNYRGIAYDYTPPAVETRLGEFSGRYRGLDWRFCNAPKHYVQQPNLDLIYRGVSYTTNASATESKTPAPVVSPVSAVVDRARDLIMRHERSLRNRQQSMLTRLNTEVGLSA